MRTKILNKTLTGIFLLILTLNFASALVVDADYITLYSGEQGVVEVKIENTENFEIEDISVILFLDKIPFVSVGSSEKDVDDIDEDDTEKIFFTLKSFTDVIPGDYEIPYSARYTNSENNSQTFEKKGSFGIRVGAKTDLDFSVEIRGNAIIGEKGRISLEVINKGLGEIKSMSVQIFPKGFELLSKDKIFIGTIDSDDTDLASFDVIYKITNPILSARIEYKDFDNKEQSETIDLSFKVYTEEKAIELGLIKKNNTNFYIGTTIVILVFWLIWRRIKKKRKKYR